MGEWYERLLAPLLAVGAAAVLACYVLGILFGSAPSGEVLLTALMVIGLPEAVRRTRLLRPVPLDPVLPDWLRAAQRVFGCTIGALCAAGLAWRVWRGAGDMLAPDAALRFDLRIVLMTYALAFLMALAACALVLMAATSLRRRPGDSAPHGGSRAPGGKENR